MCIPLIVYIAVMSYYPMYTMLIAFKDYNIRLGVWHSKWVGFKNYERLFKSVWFDIFMKNEISMSVVNWLLNLPYPFLTAFVLVEIQNYYVRTTIITVSSLSGYVGTVTMCTLITMFLSPTVGLVNHVWMALGGARTSFLTIGPLFQWIYHISMIMGRGISSSIYFIVLLGMDRAQVEAAELDGANRLKIWRYVYFPALIPVFTLNMITGASNILIGVSSEKIWLLQNNSNLFYSEVIDTYNRKIALETRDYSYGAAISLLKNAYGALCMLIANAIARRVGETSLF